MPIGMVRVVPGSEPAKVRVVPNSPRERTNARPVPVTIADLRVGSVIRHNTCHGDMPMPAAESNTSRSIWRSAASTVMTTKGSAINMCATTTPANANANCNSRALRMGAVIPRRPNSAVSDNPATTGGMANGRRIRTRTSCEPRRNRCSMMAMGTPMSTVMIVAYSADRRVMSSSVWVAGSSSVLPRVSQETRVARAAKGRSKNAHPKNANTASTPGMVMGRASGAEECGKLLGG